MLLEIDALLVEGRDHDGGIVVADVGQAALVRGGPPP
jgi:hypothetical protein